MFCFEIHSNLPPIWYCHIIGNRDVDILVVHDCVANTTPCVDRYGAVATKSWGRASFGAWPGSSILRSACTWFPMGFVFSVRGPSSVLPLAGAANRCDFGGSSHVTKKGLDAPGSGSPVKGGAMTLAPGASRSWAFRRSGHRNAAQGRLRTGQGADEATDRCRSGARRRPVAGLASPNRLECLARPHGRPASGQQLYVRS